jgi:hypothetical protein
MFANLYKNFINELCSFYPYEPRTIFYSDVLSTYEIPTQDYIYSILEISLPGKQPHLY